MECCEGPKLMEDLSAVMREHAPMIFRVALSSLKDYDAAQTIVQDCFLKAYRARDQFRAESSLRTWLTHIALNLVRDYIRNRRLRFWRQLSECPMDPDAACRLVPDRHIDPLERLVVKEKTALLWRAVARLPQQDRKIFLLRYVDGLAFPKISAVTGLPEGIVKRRAYRALECVRRVRTPAANQHKCSSIRGERAFTPRSGSTRGPGPVSIPEPSPTRRELRDDRP